ncbi:hypothetical protein Dimus_006661 [Dionaea muscipula]
MHSHKQSTREWQMRSDYTRRGTPTTTEMATTTATAAATPWKQLVLKSLESNSHLKSSTFFQFSTIGSNGRPSNRTVVFRGFEDDSEKIQINTDSRSHKVEELRHCPFAEICWYFIDSWEQFRINGQVDVIDGSCSDPSKLRQREKSWFASSLKSRLQYLGLDPGIPWIRDEQPQDVSLDPCAGPVGAFCLLVLDPNQVDYLNLKTNTRLAFTASKSENGDKYWSSDRINP